MIFRLCGSMRTRSSIITRMVSMSIVLEMAMPYAPASALEERKLRISVSVPANSSQFTDGTYTLADLFFRRMQDAQARQIAQVQRLARDREHARDHGLRSDHGRAGRQHDQDGQQPARREQIERILDRGRIGEQQRALAEVIQHQRRPARS